MNFDKLTQNEFLEFRDQVSTEFKPKFENKKSEKIVTDLKEVFRPRKIFPGTCLGCIYKKEVHNENCEFFKNET